MANYRLNNEALADLDRLYEFGISAFGLNQANEYYDGLIVHFQEIADQPKRYPAVDDIRKGYRRSMYVSHSIYYRIEGAGIVIVRVLGQQEPAKAF